MMKLLENRSQIWFKILSKDGTPIDGSKEQWIFPFPEDNLTSGFNYPSEMGTWLVSNPTQFLDDKFQIYIASLISDTNFEYPGIIWVKEVRLLRVANAIDLKYFQKYSR